MSNKVRNRAFHATADVADWKPRAACMLALVVCSLVCAALFGCASSSPSGHESGKSAEATAQVIDRAKIVSSDGTVLAETSDSADGSKSRIYPLGSQTASLVGSCYAEGAPEGIEQAYADDLANGQSVQLTIDAHIQEAAYKALGENIGALVVLDSDTGAMLAMASTPSYDPSQQDADDVELANRATELHIPGSTFKTVTLAAALESGTFSLDSVFAAPSELTFSGGSVQNYDVMQYPDQTLLQAYAKSINTVFAQLVMEIGLPRVSEEARAFGFDKQTMADFPIRASMICNESDMKPLMQAWSGVGQALYLADGELQGPLMSPVQGAVIASAVVNGGTARMPYVVESIGGEQASGARQPATLGEGVSAETAALLTQAMREVVAEGTGTGAAVAGVDVGGKTGTAETAKGGDDGWFIGFAQDDGSRYAFAVLVEGTESSEATHVAQRLIQALFTQGA